MRVELPEPDPDEREHSERLATLIRDEISAAGGAIDFARYMELALYAPGLGYYSAGAAKFGAHGDFVTAPELGFVFARCMARAVAPTLRETRGDVLELGPGSAALAAELLLEFERLGALPSRYRLLERSADLRERQRAALDARVPHLVDRCEWLDAPPSDPWRGVLLANEVIDALPVRLFSLREDGAFVRNVVCGKRGTFAFSEQPADAPLDEAIGHVLGAQAHGMPRPYRSEICTLLGPWFESVARSLQQGMALFVDYGHAREDYYAPSRGAGTLHCHYRHRVHDDPLILTGLQDITAWVDFDALREAATRAGFELAGYSTQAQFLIGNGLDEVFANGYAAAGDEAARYRLAQEVKRLSLPQEMGDAFRAMSFSRA